MEVISVIQNLGLASAVALIWYARNYLSVSNSIVREKTKPVSDEVFSYTDQISHDLHPQLERFTRPEFIEGRESGKEIQVIKVALNKIKEERGLLKTVDVFKEEKKRNVQTRVGILFANGVNSRYYEKGFPLETTVQSLYDAAEAIPWIQTCVCAYDKDVHLIKDFDDSFNSTAYGLMPAKPGYHSNLEFALETLSDFFEEAGKKKVLYVVTRPIKNRKQQEKARQKLEDLNRQRVGVGFIYLADELPSSGLGNVYCNVSRETIEQLPTLVRRMNRKL